MLRDSGCGHADASDSDIVERPQERLSNSSISPWRLVTRNRGANFLMLQPHKSQVWDSGAYRYVTSPVSGRNDSLRDLYCLRVPLLGCEVNDREDTEVD